MKQWLRRAMRFLSLSPAAHVSLGLTSLGCLFKDAMARGTSLRWLAQRRSDRQLIGLRARHGGP